MFSNRNLQTEWAQREYVLQLEHEHGRALDRERLADLDDDALIALAEIEREREAWRAHVSAEPGYVGEAAGLFPGLVGPEVRA